MSFLEVRGLRKTYGDVNAVDGVDFSVEQGEVFGLLGPNGAGKSTAISMIAGLVRPGGGAIILKGEDVTRNPARVKEVLGLVPQDVALYPTLTARENLFFWGRMYGVILRGQTLASTAPNLGVLACFGLVFFVLGAVRIKY